MRRLCCTLGRAPRRIFYGAVLSTLTGALASSYQGKALPVALWAKKHDDRFCQFCATYNGAQLREFLRNTKDVDVNTRHPSGWTALMVAAFKGDVEMVRELLAHGAEVDAVDTSPAEGSWERTSLFRDLSSDSCTRGFTALFYAVLAEKMDVVDVLLAAGASPDVRDHRNRTALDMVRYVPNINQKFKDELQVKLTRAAWGRDKETRRQYPLEQRLMERIVGQTATIHAVAAAIRRKQNGWQDADRPLVFLFLGSSGVGKTELAKQVAAYIHGKDANDNHFIRIDMSEYQTQHEVSKFIGSPPGYVGHDEGGQLTKRLEACPKAVVLLDEVEKAHPDLLTILLQVFDEGRLTDGHGMTVRCNDAIFVMTSNLGQREIADEVLRMRKVNQPDELGADFKEQVIQPILTKHFKRDEFLGRINEILFFLPFTQSQLQELARHELSRWKEVAKSRHDMELEWDTAVEELLTRAYNVRYGARSIKHEVERKVVSKLAQAHEDDRIAEGSRISLSVEKNLQDVRLVISKREKTNSLLAAAKGLLRQY